jgi:hypothetical protein
VWVAVVFGVLVVDLVTRTAVPFCGLAFGPLPLSDSEVNTRKSARPPMTSSANASATASVAIRMRA